MFYNMQKESIFMWASGHDLWSSSYISECVELLETNPTAIIAFGASQWIDQDGNSISRQFGWTDTRGLDLISRYVITFWGNMHPILGLINKNILALQPLQQIAGTDMIVLCRLCIAGDFVHATKANWCRREIRQESTYSDKLKRYSSDEYGLVKSSGKIITPLIKLPIELLKNIISSDQSILIKVLLSFLLISMLPTRYIAGKIVNTRSK